MPQFPLCADTEQDTKVFRLNTNKLPDTIGWQLYSMKYQQTLQATLLPRLETGHRAHLAQTLTQHLWKPREMAVPDQLWAGVVIYVIEVKSYHNIKLQKNVIWNYTATEDE